MSSRKQRPDPIGCAIIAIVLVSLWALLIWGLASVPWDKVEAWLDKPVPVGRLLIVSVVAAAVVCVINLLRRGGGKG